MDKNNVVELAIKTLEKELVLLSRTIQQEDKKRQQAPSAMQSWSDNTRFEKEVLISQLEENKGHMKKHISFLKSLGVTKKSKIEQGALVKIENLTTNKVNFYFVSFFAGLELKIQNTEVIFLSKDSPIIKVLLSRKQGDKVTTNLGSPAQELKILSIE